MTFEISEWHQDYFTAVYFTTARYGDHQRRVNVTHEELVRYKHPAAIAHLVELRIKKAMRGATMDYLTSSAGRYDIGGAE